MPSLLLIARAELVKLTRRPQTWILLIALLAVLALGFNTQVGRAQAPPPETDDPFVRTPEEYRQAVTLPGAFDQVQVYYHWPNVLLLLLVTVTVSQDFTWGTMRTTLSREPNRARLLLARLAAIAAVAALYLLVVWIAYGAMGLQATRSLHGQVGLDFLDGAFLGQQVAALARTWVATLPVIAFGLFVAFWARNPAIALTLSGMGYFLVWMTLMVSLGLLLPIAVMSSEAGRDLASTDFGIWGMLPTLTPHYNMTAVVHWGEPSTMATDASLAAPFILGFDLPHGPWRGLGLLLGYSLLCLVGAWWLFRHKDVAL